jgi:hypothetical protein
MGHTVCHAAQIYSKQQQQQQQQQQRRGVWRLLSAQRLLQQPCFVSLLTLLQQGAVPADGHDGGAAPT